MTQLLPQLLSIPPRCIISLSAALSLSRVTLLTPWNDCSLIPSVIAQVALCSRSPFAVRRSCPSSPTAFALGLNVHCSIGRSFCFYNLILALIPLSLSLVFLRRLLQLPLALSFCAVPWLSIHVLSLIHGLLCRMYNFIGDMYSSLRASSMYTRQL